VLQSCFICFVSNRIFWCFSYAARLSKGLASSWPCLTTNHDTYKWSECTFFSSNWQSEAHVHCLKAQVVQGHAPTLYKGAAGLLFKVLSECQLKSSLFLKRNVYSKAAPSWSGWNRICRNAIISSRSSRSKDSPHAHQIELVLGDLGYLCYPAFDLRNIFLRINSQHPGPGRSSLETNRYMCFIVFPLPGEGL